jgi:hypothetical protein
MTVWDAFQCYERECIKRRDHFVFAVRFEIRIASAIMAFFSATIVVFFRQYFQNYVEAQYVSTELDSLRLNRLEFRRGNLSVSEFPTIIETA